MWSAAEKGVASCDPLAREKSKTQLATWLKTAGRQNLYAFHRLRDILMGLTCPYIIVVGMGKQMDVIC